VAEADCDTSSEWLPKAAAIASQHGNNAVLSQNIAHATTNPTRAKLRRPRVRLAPDILVEVRVLDSMFIKLHPGLYKYFDPDQSPVGVGSEWGV
jgi:hypothetical protein